VGGASAHLIDAIRGQGIAAPLALLITVFFAYGTTSKKMGVDGAKTEVR